MAYINRENFIQVLAHENSNTEIGRQYYGAIYQKVMNFPTADVVEVKHGYFKRNERNIPKMKEFHEKGYALSMNEKSIFYTCSCCGSWCSLSQNYCSECGARMDGTPKERGGEK